jgi:hypothetical protein
MFPVLHYWTNSWSVEMIVYRGEKSQHRWIMQMNTD